MSRIDEALSAIRPSLRIVAPQTFYFSIVFGTFNVAVGLGLITSTTLVKLRVVGIIPLKTWGFIFLIHGLFILYSLYINNWNLARNLNMLGVFIKCTWWLELLAEAITHGGFPFVLFMWSTLLAFQIIVCRYFTPRMRDDTV